MWDDLCLEIWGKLGTGDGPSPPLIHHLLGTGHAAVAMWERALGPVRRQNTSKDRLFWD